MTCGTCALPVDDAMCRCPWCTSDLEDSDAVRPRARKSMSAECVECALAVRPDWSACPWCGTSFAWTLATATESVRKILEEAGAFAIARRIQLAYSRKAHSYVWDGDDRNIQLVAARLRNDARNPRMFPRARRMCTRERFLAFDHPLHLPLHEAGHVFENYLRKRRLLDLAEAATLFGDLDQPYEDDWTDKILAGLRWHQPSFVSSYATVHPAEDFAETFAVAAFLRGDTGTLRRWAKYGNRGPAVVRALEWMSALIARHGR